MRGKEERVAPSRPAHSIPFASLLSASFLSLQVEIKYTTKVGGGGGQVEAKLGQLAWSSR